MGWWPSRAVTFLDNHDTGSTQAHWPFPGNHIMEGHQQCFTDHFYDWGTSIHDQIVKLIDIRKQQDIHSRSPIRILEAQPNLYSAIIGEKLSMKIGDGSWCPGRPGNGNFQLVVIDTLCGARITNLTYPNH
ncbi:putative alpha-amylase 2 [Bienertia sinuspersici]